MRIVQVVLAILLCLLVWSGWRSGEHGFAVLHLVTIPYAIMIPIAVISLIGSLWDLVAGPDDR